MRTCPWLKLATRKSPKNTCPLSTLFFLKAWLQGTHHGRVEPQHLQAYLNEFTFRFNALTGASTRSTLSAPCLALEPMAKARPMPVFTRELGSIRRWKPIMTDQPLGVVCSTRISMFRFTHAVRSESP